MMDNVRQIIFDEIANTSFYEEEWDLFALMLVRDDVGRAAPRHRMQLMRYFTQDILMRKQLEFTKLACQPLITR